MMKASWGLLLRWRFGWTCVVTKEDFTDESDFEISQLCYMRALEFINKNEKSTDSNIAAQVKVLEYLFFRFINYNNRGYISTKELMEAIKPIYNGNLNKDTFRMQIIGKLRDADVIIASSNMGYKIPSNRKELNDYAMRSAQIIIPMLSRLDKCRKIIRLGTLDKVDVLDSPEYEILRKLFDSELYNE